MKNISRGQRERKKLENAMLLTFNIEVRAMSQEMQVAFRGWKSQGNGIPPRASKRNPAMRTPWF